MADELLANGRSETSSSHSISWRIFGGKFPKSEVVFFSQVFLIYAVVITSLVNISLGSTQELWTVLLTSCLGYLMPNPSLKQQRRSSDDGEHVHDST